MGRTLFSVRLESAPLEGVFVVIRFFFFVAEGHYYFFYGGDYESLFFVLVIVMAINVAVYFYLCVC